MHTQKFLGFCLSILFASLMRAMELKTTLISSQISHTADAIPPLKKLCLRYIAQSQSDNFKVCCELAESEREVLKSGNNKILQTVAQDGCLFAEFKKECSDIFAPYVIASADLFPRAISRSGEYSFSWDYPHPTSKRKLVVTCFPTHSITLPMDAEFSTKTGTAPLFVACGKYILGWKDREFFPECLVCVESNSGKCQQIQHPIFIGRDVLAFDVADDEETLFFRDNKNIFTGRLESLQERGFHALEKIYTRLGEKEYPGTPQYYSYLKVLTTSLIAVVSPHAIGFELVSKNERGVWSCNTYICIGKKINSIAYGVINRLAAVSFDKEPDALYFYDFNEETLGKRSCITVPHIDSFKLGCFSPCANYFACGTTFERGEIEIIACSNPAEPIRACVILVSQKLPLEVRWDKPEKISALDGNGKVFDVHVRWYQREVFEFEKELEKEKTLSNNNNG